MPRKKAVKRASARKPTPPQKRAAKKAPSKSGPKKRAVKKQSRKPHKKASKPSKGSGWTRGDGKTEKVPEGARKEPHEGSEPHAPPDDRRCTKKSKQRQARCRQYRMPGVDACWYHGGAAPQTLEAAKRRLLAAADPAAFELVENLKAEDEGERRRTATEILDRVGIPAVSRNEHGGIGGGPIPMKVWGVEPGGFPAPVKKKAKRGAG